MTSMNQSMNLGATINDFQRGLVEDAPQSEKKKAKPFEFVQINSDN